MGQNNKTLRQYRRAGNRGNIFKLDSRCHSHKVKNDQWNYIKIRSLCPSKVVINKCKGKPDNGKRYLQHVN